jgi:hypothetical protein
MAAVRGFSPPKYSNYGGQVSFAQHGGPGWPPRRLLHIQQLDLQKGYYQVPVADEDIPKTAIITPFGLFEFLRMPFGLKNAGMTFQRLMDRLFFDILCVFVYLDDLLVASCSVEEHRIHLRAVMQRLHDNGLVINTDKCVWGQPSLEFLGHQVSAAGVAPLASRIEAVKNFPCPCTVQQLQAFLGLINFYRRFIPAAAAILRPLTDALCGSPKGTAAVQWSAAMTAAIAAAKAALGRAALLDHPAEGEDISLVTDASSSAIGAVLQQRRRAATCRSVYFPGSWRRRNAATVHSTESFWQFIVQFFISATC